MTPTQLISLAIVALLIFWSVGAYNRLVRLKNTIAKSHKGSGLAFVVFSLALLPSPTSSP